MPKRIKEPRPASVSHSLFCSVCDNDHGVDEADHIPADIPLSSVLQMICAHSLCLTDLKTLLWVLETRRLIPIHLGFILGLGPLWQGPQRAVRRTKLRPLILSLKCLKALRGLLRVYSLLLRLTSFTICLYPYLPKSGSGLHRPGDKAYS